MRCVILRGEFVSKSIHTVVVKCDNTKNTYTQPLYEQYSQHEIAFVHGDAFIEKIESGSERQQRPQYSEAGRDLATMTPCVKTVGPDP